MNPWGCPISANTPPQLWGRRHMEPRLVVLLLLIGLFCLIAFVGVLFLVSASD